MDFPRLIQCITKLFHVDKKFEIQVHGSLTIIETILGNLSSSLYNLLSLPNFGNIEVLVLYFFGYDCFVSFV